MSKLSGTPGGDFRVWRSLVSRLNGVQEALSSNLSTRTKEQSSKEGCFFLLQHHRKLRACTPQALIKSAVGLPDKVGKP